MSRTLDGRLVGRLIAEGIVVIASILIAFALDAWWAEREVRREMSQEMESIRQELVRNRDRVADEIRAMERIVGAGEAFTALLDQSPGDTLVSVPDTLAWLVSSWAPSLEMSFGAVDALIGSGRLAQVPDPALRLGLAGLRDRFDDVLEDQLVSRKLHLEEELPLLYSAMDMAPFMAMDSEFFVGGPAGDRKVPSIFGFLEYPNSLEIRNVIRLRASWYVSALGEARPLLAHMEDLLTLVD